MKIIIIDDEINARKLLENLVSDVIDSAEIFQAKDLKEGVELIKNQQPDLVFLDVEMPNEQGVEIYKYFEKEPMTFSLVFTTAYSQYALKAFELNASDYLLKPIRPSKIREVIQRVSEDKKRENVYQKLEDLNQTLINQSLNKVGMPVKDGIEFVNVDDIVHIKGEGMYTSIYTSENKDYLISKPLKFFEYITENYPLFYRAHRSHIINLKYLKQYVRKDGNYVVLENENIVPVSKERREEFLQKIASN